MANQPQKLPIIDPDKISEILCDGMFNISITGPLATITFTHVRHPASNLFVGNTGAPEAIVRARIVTPIPNLVILRDLLNTIIQSVNIVPVSPAPAPATGGPTHH